MSENEVTVFPRAVMLIPAAHDATVGFANRVIKGITGNVDMQPAPPELATLIDDNEAYAKANTAARGGGKVAVANRRAARRDVVNGIAHLRDRVQSAAEKLSAADAAALIVACGFQVKKVTKRNKPPLSAKNGANAGSAVLEALRVAAVAMYMWQYSTDQVHWVDVPQTMKAKALITGLTPGQTYYFRFRAQTRKGDVDFSQVVSLMVR